MEDLLAHKPATWLEDVERRFRHGVDGAGDAFGVIADGGRILSAAMIARHGPVGLLEHVYTRPEHRRRGLARDVLAMLVSWFDMVGGKRLYLGAAADITRVYEPHGFRALHQAARDGVATVMMVRGETAAASLYDEPAPACTVRSPARNDWPMMVELLQFRPGPDARTELAASAVSAELAGLELLSQQDRGLCALFVAEHGGVLRNVASVAIDQLGERTYAMMMPHDAPNAALREALLRFAESRGYKHVEFPLESLACA